MHVEDLLQGVPPEKRGALAEALGPLVKEHQDAMQVNTHHLVQLRRQVERESQAAVRMYRDAIKGDPS